jgi:hypothetical protein
MSLGSPGIRCQPGETLPLPPADVAVGPPRPNPHVAHWGRPFAKIGPSMLSGTRGYAFGSARDTTTTICGSGSLTAWLAQSAGGGRGWRAGLLRWLWLHVLLLRRSIRQLGIVLELEEVFRGDGRPYPPGKHSLLNAREGNDRFSTLKFWPVLALRKKFSRQMYRYFSPWDQPNVGLDPALPRVVAERALGWVSSLYASKGHV